MNPIHFSALKLPISKTSHFILAVSSNALDTITLKMDAIFTFTVLRRDSPASTTPSLAVAAPEPWGPSFSRALKGSLEFL